MEIFCLVNKGENCIYPVSDPPYWVGIRTDSLLQYFLLSPVHCGCPYIYQESYIKGREHLVIVVIVNSCGCTGEAGVSSWPYQQGAWRTCHLNVSFLVSSLDRYSTQKFLSGDPAILSEHRGKHVPFNPSRLIPSPVRTATGPLFCL